MAANTGKNRSGNTGHLQNKRRPLLPVIPFLRHLKSMRNQIKKLLEIAALIVRLLRGGFNAARPQDLRVRPIFLNYKNSINMKRIAKRLLLQAVLTTGISMLPLLMFTGCGNHEAAVPAPTDHSHGTLAALGFDQSLSMAGYRQLDTVYVGSVCRNVAQSGGGIVVVFGIGEPSDHSGLRCYLKHVPKMDHGMVLSKQAELRTRIDKIAAENERAIRDLLVKVQDQIFDPAHDTTRKVMNTDINGFFHKVAVLLDEPEHRGMRSVVFCHSDGVHSIDGVDTPARFSVETKNAFTLCLSGWKTVSPCKSVEVIPFEDPVGFLQYIGNNNFKNI